jgi:hypothetical protein
LGSFCKIDYLLLFLLLCGTGDLCPLAATKHFIVCSDRSGVGTRRSSIEFKGDGSNATGGTVVDQVDFNHRPRQGRAVIATALLTVVVMAVKLGTYNPLSRDPRCHISISASGVIEALCRYFDALIYREGFLRQWGCWRFAR